MKRSIHEIFVTNIFLKGLGQTPTIYLQTVLDEGISMRGYSGGFHYFNQEISRPLKYGGRHQNLFTSYITLVRRKIALYNLLNNKFLDP